MLNRLVSQPNGVTRNRVGIMDALVAFNGNAGGAAGGVDITAPDFSMQDELKPLLAVLGGQSGAATGSENVLPVDLELGVARAVKILLRKPVNRTSLGQFGVKCIIDALGRQIRRVTAATPEIGNAALNACYNGSNISPFLDNGGLPVLLQLLRTRDVAVQGSILGVLQSLCFVSKGRRAFLDDETVRYFGCLDFYKY